MRQNAAISHLYGKGFDLGVPTLLLRMVEHLFSSWRTSEASGNRTGGARWAPGVAELNCPAILEANDGVRVESQYDDEGMDMWARDRMTGWEIALEEAGGWVLISCAHDE